MEIRAGAGGEDARLFVRKLISAYMNLAKARGWKMETLERRDEKKGTRSVSFLVSGEGVNDLKTEGGVHRIQHETRSRKKDRIHTSTATVAVLQIPKSADAVNRDEVNVEFFRASGAGGQHRNKTENAVRLTHRDTGISAVIDGRSRESNLKQAWQLIEARITERRSAEIEKSLQKKRHHQTMADRARSIRTYDEIRDVVRTSDGRKIKGVAEVLDGRLPVG